MRGFLFLLFMFLATGSAGQPGVSYRPDTLSPLGNCDTLHTLPYFSVGGKYPLSSEALARRADSALPVHDTAVSGYFSFRLLIDCEGRLRRHRLLQTDAQYRPAYFPPGTAAGLFAFVAALDAWPQKRAGNALVNYRTYLSFKLIRGHVVAVSP